MLASSARQKATARIYASRTFYGRYSVIEENGLIEFADRVALTADVRSIREAFE